MTKPNDFIMNSDYLSLAQTNKAEFTAYFGAQTFPSGEQIELTQDFSLPAIAGAMDRILISHNGGDYMVGNNLVLSMNSPMLIISVYRPDAATLRVRLREHTANPDGYSMPTQTIKVKVSSFKVPNML